MGPTPGTTARRCTRRSIAPISSAARNIGDPDTLAAIVEEAGLPAAAARAALADRSFKDAVDADWSRSRDMGVTGVPTYAAAGYGVVGAQPYEVLVELLEHAGAAPRRS